MAEGNEVRGADVTSPEHLKMLQGDNHVAYELLMLRAMRDALPFVRNSLLGNAALESYLIHSRNLIDFYYPKPQGRKPSDVFAYHYVDGGEGLWEQVCARDEFPDIFGQTIEEVFTAISTRLAHITLDRLQKVEWDFHVLGGGLDLITDRWLRHLNNETKVAWPTWRQWASSTY